MTDKDNIEIENEEPVAVFKSKISLLAVNILSRMLPAAVFVMLAYFAVSLPVKSLRTDPVALFLGYWPYLLLLCAVLAAVWVLWFHIVTIYAYKTRMVICKRGRQWTVDYDSIIAFTWERDFMVFIPMPVDKTIVSAGSGRTNKIKSCSCISKQDFFRLHHICNADRPAGCEIPMNRSTHFQI